MDFRENNFGNLLLYNNNEYVGEIWLCGDVYVFNSYEDYVYSALDLAKIISKLNELNDH